MIRMIYRPLLAIIGVWTVAGNASVSSQSNCPPGGQSAFAPTDKLPDPFTFLDGRPVKTKAEWQCRKEEIRTILQEYELGFKPAKPASVKGTLVDNSLHIVVSENAKNISFSVPITWPSVDRSHSVPLLIGLNFSLAGWKPAGFTVPQPAGVATLQLDVDEIAAHGGPQSRNKGKFFDLYGPNGTGALMAWAWAVSRIIDVIEATPGIGIDPKRIAVTGCSRWGKGALVAGAFDERIALVLPQESGAGGTACWRLCDFENEENVKKKLKTQTAAQIVTENVWFGTNFTENAKKSVNDLPYDHHLLMGLIAPRGLFSFDNEEPKSKWLAPFSTWGCAHATRLIYEAMGAADAFGESMTVDHEHCVFPSEQRPELQAFVDRFLFAKSASAPPFSTKSQNGFNTSRWINWKAPTLV
jgi:hypothetical protein